MPLDDDADDDDAALRPPLPPEDRLWRHPSELRLHGLAGTPVPAPARAPGRAGGWGVVAVAGLAGAVLAAGLMALSGQLDDRVVDRRVVEKVAVSPIVSSPVLHRDDRSVAAVVRRLQPSIVRLDLTGPDGASTGSGVVFRDDGMVLTSAHLVDDAERIRVRLHDGRRTDGSVVGLDPVTDLAVVDIDADDVPAAVLGTSDGLEIGATALAVGCHHPDSGPAVTTGIISAMGRTLGSDGMTLHGLLQTDAPIAASSSGGALVDITGAVIGIVTAFADEAGIGDADRYGFATPIDLAHRVARQLIDHGVATHGWLGIEGIDLDPGTADSMGVPSGALVRAVDEGGPADQAGIGGDDVITEVDGRPVESMPGLAVEMRKHQPGDEVEVRYVRDGEPREAEVTVGERPAPADRRPDEGSRRASATSTPG